MTTSHPPSSTRATAPAVSSASARRLLVAQAAASFGLAAGGTSGPLLTVDMTGSEAAGVLPVGLLAIGAAVAAPAITRVMNRRGRRAGLVAGYRWALIGALMELVAVVIDSVAMLLAGSAVLGTGTAAVMLTRYAVADLAPPDERGRALSRSLFVTTSGAVIGPLLLRPAAVLAETVGLQREAGLYVIALVAFLLGGQLLRRGPEPAGIGGEALADVDVEATSAAAAGSARVRVTNERVALVILATANAVMVAVMAMAVVHLRAHGYDLGTIGAMVSVHVVAMFALAPVIGSLSDSVGAARLAVVGAGILASIGLLGAVNDDARMVHMGGLMFALGVAWSIQIVAGSSMLALAAPGRDQRAAEGRAESAMGAAAGLATVVAAAPLASLGGFRLVSVAVALASAATGIHLLRVTSPRSSTPRSQPEHR
jgi:MFS family permease